MDNILALIYSRCECKDGYRLASDGRSCEIRMDGCEIGINGGCEHDCYDQPDGGVKCGCRMGFRLDDNNYKSCIGKMKNCQLS